VARRSSSGEKLEQGERRRALLLKQNWQLFGQGVHGAPLLGVRVVVFFLAEKVLVT
jgi:hypothetical protein